jgi:hypothetical protein
MWLITPIGFFSIVEKPGDAKRNVLTVRARVRSDLTALKNVVLPSLGRISESLETDYRYRAKAPRGDISKATARMIADLHYGNFKSEVAARQGGERAHLYHDVWDVLYRLQGDPRFEAGRRGSNGP